MYKFWQCYENSGVCKKNTTNLGKETDFKVNLIFFHPGYYIPAKYIDDYLISSIESLKKLLYINFKIQRCATSRGYCKYCCWYLGNTDNGKNSGSLV